MVSHHNNMQFHKRVAALKQRRLPAEEEAASLNLLVARFSPTFDLATMFPTPTTDPAAAITTSVDPSPIVGDPVSTDPTTTSADPAATDTSAVTSNTDTTSSSVLPTTDNSPVTTTSTTVVIAPATTSSTTPVTTLSTTPLLPTSSSTLSTRIITSSATLSSAASTPSQSASSDSGTNVAGIVGGIVGAMAGIAAIVMIIRFLMNRRRKSDDDAFNATDFRRSAVLMDDPPTHDDTIERGFNPRPPTMIERRLASPAPTFGTQYGYPGPAVAPTEFDYQQYHAYGPSQMRSPSPANPMLMNSPYPNPAYTEFASGQSPFSPTDATHNEGQQAAVLTRQPSNATALDRAPSPHGPSGYPSEDPHFGGYPSPKRAQYVDLDRSSVTPYQAAQYAEISHRLNTDVPSGLDTPAVDAFIQNNNQYQTAPPVPSHDAVTMPEPSPFADPEIAPAAALPLPGEATPRPSTDSVARAIDEFPVPPSPAHSRIDSNPPMLPEIHLDSRPASYDFPASVRGSGFASGIPVSVTKDYSRSPLANGFPLTPSPLASSFAITSPPPAATEFPTAAAAAADSPPPTPRLDKTQEAPKKRPDTVYDDEDAYGGI